MNLSKRDISIIVVILFIGIVIGWSANHIWNSRNKPSNIDNPVNKSLIKKADSLESIVYYKDSVLKASEKIQAEHDSIIVHNNKNLNKEYEKIKNFSNSARIRYIDSVLRAVNIRR